MQNKEQESVRESIKQQIKEEFEEKVEKVRDGIDDVTSGRLYDSSNEKPSIRVWLKQHDKEHLFENEPYGKPMLDLSEEKLLAFLSTSIDKTYNGAIKEALEVVEEIPANTPMDEFGHVFRITAEDMKEAVRTALNLLLK